MYQKQYLKGRLGLQVKDLKVAESIGMMQNLPQSELMGTMEPF